MHDAGSDASIRHSRVAWATLVRPRELDCGVTIEFRNRSCDISLLRQGAPLAPQARARYPLDATGVPRLRDCMFNLLTRRQKTCALLRVRGGRGSGGFRP